MKIYIKKIIIPVLIYLVISAIFLIIIPKNKMNINVPFMDLYLFGLMLIVYFYIIFSFNFRNNDIYRFNTINKFLFFKMKEFSIYNFFIQIITTFLYLLIFFIKGVVIKIDVILHYVLNLYCIFQILYLLCLASFFSKNQSRNYYFVFFLFYFMFLLCFLDSSNIILPFNIFLYYFRIGRLNNIIMNYSIWILGSLIFINIKKEKIEL